MPETVPRAYFKKRIARLLETRRITVLLGPRQCGKTTLARMFLKPSEENYFDLEDPVSFNALQVEPMLLERLHGLVVIDEVQRMPDLFPILRVLADRDPNPARFLLLGSASQELSKRASETLAGRASFVDLGGFDLEEIGEDRADQLWLRGGFPESFLSRSDRESFEWRESFVRTFLEQDIPQFGLRVPAPRLRRFWMFLANEQGHIWNSSKLGKALGTHHATTQNYLHILEHTFMVRTLKPYSTNIKKRLVKSPKVYFRDTGLLHYLLGIDSMKALESHPVYGFSWEGFAIEQILATLRPSHEQYFFWGTQAGAEIDLLVQAHGKLFGFEFKRSSTPKTSASMHRAMEDLSLAHLYVIYPGRRDYALADKIRAYPFANIGALPMELDRIAHSQ